MHRRPQFRAHARSVEQLHASTVEVLTPYEVEKVSGDPVVDEVVVASKDATADTCVPTPWSQPSGSSPTWAQWSSGASTCASAGDIADHDGKVKLISVGFGEAALAVNHIAHLLDPSTSTAPGTPSDA